MKFALSATCALEMVGEQLPTLPCANLSLLFPHAYYIELHLAQIPGWLISAPSKPVR
jgi:hypothetical protein